MSSVAPSAIGPPSNVAVSDATPEPVGPSSAVACTDEKSELSNVVAGGEMIVMTGGVRSRTTFSDADPGGSRSWVGSAAGSKANVWHGSWLPPSISHAPSGPLLGRLNDAALASTKVYAGGDPGGWKKRYCVLTWLVVNVA